MDLVYCNENGIDIGVLMDYELDLAFGSEENDFECKVSRDNNPCKSNYSLYIEETEYGGIVGKITVDTDTDEVIYNGKTWQGLLNEKVILPLTAADQSTEAVKIQAADSTGASLINKYFIITGDSNRCLEYLLNRMGLQDLFAVPEEDAGIQIKSYQFNRFVYGYEGIASMLKASGAKLKIIFKGGKVRICSEKIVDYSQDEQFDTDQMPLKIVKDYRPVNHLICLGKGELEDRLIIHLYSDENGNISQKQSLFGIQEVTDKYELSSEEDETELISQGKKKFLELRSTDEVDTDFDSDDERYDIGDIVGAKDVETGVEASAEITKKIVTINNNEITISYKVGD